MKIKNISLFNFKALLEADLPLDGCSCIVTGKNDGGKSSLLRGMIDRFRGEIPNVIVHEGETKGGYAMELTDGSKIEWFFTGKTERFQFTTVEGVLEKTGVFSSIAKKYFGDKFDIDKFINGTPKYQEKELQRLVGLDFTDVNKRLKTQFELRTDANREAKRLKDNPVRKPEKVKKIDISDLEFDLEMINDKNDILKDQWKVDNEKHLSDITKFNKEQDDHDAYLDKVQEAFDYLDKAYEYFEGCINIVEARKIINDMKLAQPRKGIEILPEPEYNSTGDIDLQIRKANATAITYASYVKDLESHNKWVTNKEAADKLQTELNEKVTAVELEKSNMIKKANMPEEFSVGEDGLTYKGFVLSNAQISLSGKYIAALKLGSLSLGLIQAMHFDASALDNVNLAKVQEWADANDLQLMIERPCLEGGEIQYTIIDKS